MISAISLLRINRVAFLCLVLTLSAQFHEGQSLKEPQREELLNGLRVLIWSRPSDGDVLIKLRIHSGGAFDLAGKSGQMALLGDILFPDPATREYFTDEMQGRLSVVTDYDGMTITMQGKATGFELMIEMLRNGIVSTQLSPEIVNSVREGRAKIAKETSISPATVADRAVAARLFGDFPYGQPYMGSPESLARVGRSDLMLAHERFLNPNNATLAIVGGVQVNRALRALRQLMGSWRKSERVIPATFRQPTPPDPRTLIVNTPGDDSVEIRLAARGLARADKDTLAANLLASVMRERWQKLMPELTRNPVFVRHEPRVLPGIFVMGASVKSGTAQKALATAKEVVKSILTIDVTAAELEQARTEAMIALNKSLSNADGTAEAWLNVDTYKLPLPNDELAALQRLSVTDLQRAAKSIFGSGNIASVAVGNAEQLRAQLGSGVPIEVLGEVQPNSPPADKPSLPKNASPTKPE